MLQLPGLDCKAAAGSVLEKGAEKSPTKTRQPRKIDLRARYWAFLFDNLRRAVDEIYVTCESDQSVVECKVGAGLLFHHIVPSFIFETSFQSSYKPWSTSRWNFLNTLIKRKLNLGRSTTFYFMWPCHWGMLPNFFGISIFFLANTRLHLEESLADLSIKIPDNPVSTL